MKGEYYKKVSLATADLIQWIQDTQRPSWSSFIRTMLLKYGFGNKKMLSILNDSFPNFSIDKEKLVRID